MDEDKLRKDRERAYQAQALLDNETLKDAMTYLEQCYLDVWKVAKTPQAREECWHNYRGHQRFLQHFETVVSNGRLADAQIAQMVRAQKRERQHA